MSDSDPRTPPTLDPGAGSKETHNIPPLVWIVIVVLIALAALAYFGGKNLMGGQPAASAAASAPASGG